MPKNWCRGTVVLEKTPESPLDSEEIKPVNLKGNQPWKLTGRTDAEADAPVFWSLDVNSWLNGKVPDAGKDRAEGKRVSEDEMAWWHHQRNGHELGWTPGDGEGQGGLACCSPWGCKGSDTNGQLNNKLKRVRQILKYRLEVRTQQEEGLACEWAPKLGEKRKWSIPEMTVSGSKKI